MGVDSQVVSANSQPGRMDEGIDVVRDSVLPAVRDRSGLQSVSLLVDREGNKIIGISFWDSEADVAGLMSSGFYQEQVAKFAALFAGPREREVYEVAVESAARC